MRPVLEAIADSIADPQTLLHLRFSICVGQSTTLRGQSAKISPNPLSGKPKRTQTTQTNPNQPKRTQTNPNKLQFDFRFDTLFGFAPGCARLRPSCTPQIGQNMSICSVLMSKPVKTGIPLLKLEIQHG